MKRAVLMLVLAAYAAPANAADVYVKVGMDLDYWAQAILDGSRNAEIEVVDCSLELPPDRRLNVPTRVDASMGDVHEHGNPHYWLDPENGKGIAAAIAKGLAKADPENAGRYEANRKAFASRLDEKKIEWARKAEPLRGMKIVTYHDSWPYFSRAFGIEVVTVDERLSSREAEESLRRQRRSGELGRRIRREDVDKEAARVLLRQWLDGRGT